MAQVKPTLKYRVVQGRNPRTGETLMRPVITARESYDLDQVVAYALNAGYVRGQFHDMRGALNGLIEAVQQLGREGKSVCLNNWMRIHGELTGTVGESRQLTSANELRVSITALTDLKGDVGAFSWQNVDESAAAPKVDTVAYVGAAKSGEVKKSAPILVTGRNLAYSAAIGDSVTVGWTQDGEATSVTVSPTESDYAHMRLAWPAALDEVPAGTELTLTLKLHGGVEGGAVMTAVKTAKLIEA